MRQYSAYMCHFSDNLGLNLKHYQTAYRFPMLSRVKTRNEIPFPHKFTADIFSKFQLQFQQHFSDLNIGRNGTT